MNRILTLLALLLIACQRGPLVNVVGEGFSGLSGKTVRFVTTNLTRGREVERGELLVKDGGFEITPAGIEPGQAYRIDVFIDVLADNVCDVSTDHMFSLDIGANDLDDIGDGILSFHHEASDATRGLACESFGAGRFSVVFTGMPEDTTIEARLFEAAGRRVQTIDGSTGGGAGTLEMEGAILPNRFYEVVIWLNESPSATCGPEDKVWVLPTGAVGIPGGGLGVGVRFDSDFLADCARLNED